MKPANDDAPVMGYDIADCVDTLICPVTGQPCMTEQNEHCEDYGCARRAGYDVDGAWQ